MNDELELADATAEDALVEQTDHDLWVDDASQEAVSQEPIGEDDVLLDDEDYDGEVYG